MNQKNVEETTPKKSEAQYGQTRTAQAGCRQRSPQLPLPALICERSTRKLRPSTTRSSSAAVAGSSYALFFRTGSFAPLIEDDRRLSYEQHQARYQHARSNHRRPGESEVMTPIDGRQNHAPDKQHRAYPTPEPRRDTTLALIVAAADLTNR